MARQHSTGTDSDCAPSQSKRRLRVLVVDQEPQVYQMLGRCGLGRQVRLDYAATLAEARQLSAAEPVDVALIESNLSDGSGLTLTAELSRGQAVTQTIVIASQPTVQTAVEALRAGAADFMTKPLTLRELKARVAAVVKRRHASLQQRRELRRLKRHCHRLNRLRREVTEQVDILCADLVGAYQELAGQMNQVVQTSEFAGTIRGELDLEQLLRKTLEYLLEKAGPTNAAIFLPAQGDEYTTAGYVNYDCSSDSADLLLEHLADVLAPKAASLPSALHLTDNQQLNAWVGDDAAYLADSHLLVFSARHEEESLAVIALFRDGDTPFDPALIETCDTIGPLLGDYLAKLIRIHHRHLRENPADPDQSAA